MLNSKARRQEFAKLVSECENLEQQKKLCEEELNELRKHYTTSTLKSCVTDYRKAMMLELGLTRYTEPPICYFSLTKDETRKVAETTAKNLNVRSSARVDLTDKWESYITTAETLLDSESYLKVLGGLALLTGRRPYSELLINGSFESTDRDDTVTFKGQAKTRREFENPYEIPVLAPAIKVINGLERLRQLKPITEDKIEGLKNRVSPSLGIVAAKNFGTFTTPKDLRGMYAAICYHCFSDPRVAVESYYAEILGHSKVDLDGCLIADPITSRSYNKFFIRP